MALTLRETTDARFTNKGAKLTNSEMDANFVGLHDLIDANASNIQLIAGSTLFGVQELENTGEWNGTSPVIEVDCSTNTPTITIPTEYEVSGMRVTIIDIAGNANTNNITIVLESGNNISGAANYQIATDEGAVTIHMTESDATSDGAKVISKIT